MKKDKPAIIKLDINKQTRINGNKLVHRVYQAHVSMGKKSIYGVRFKVLLKNSKGYFNIECKRFSL